MIICGIDEAGRGPIMGPLVVGAVWTSDERKIADLGVRDSKALTPRQRESLYDEIDKAADFWEVIPISAETIDNLMRHRNLNEIEMNYFAEIAVKHPSELVEVDCPEVKTQRFGAILSTMQGGLNVDAQNKADSLFPTVSAASIMAKVTRDRLMEDIKTELGTDVGSGYPADPITKAFVENWINKNGSVPPHTRKSWEPVKNMMSRRVTKSLDDW